MKKGLWTGIRMTPKPRRIRFVRWLIAASTMSGEEQCPISMKKCCSVIQKWSKPAPSAASAWVMQFQNPSRSVVAVQGRGIWI